MIGIRSCIQVRKGYAENLKPKDAIDSYLQKDFVRFPALLATDAEMAGVSAKNCMSDDEFRFLSLRRLPARLVVDEVAWLLRCTPEDVHVLTRSGLIKPLGNPPVNGKKLFPTKKILESLDDPNWLARITNAIYRRWQDKNASRRTVKNSPLNHHARLA